MALGAIALIAVPSAQAVSVPPNFNARTLPIPRAGVAPAPGYINGLRRPTTIDFAPDGKMFVAEWLGRVKVFDSVGDTTPTLAVDIAIEVHSFSDRGLTGMKLDPQFGTAEHNYVYLDYAYDQAMGSATPPKAESSDGGDSCKYEPPYTDCVVSGRVVRIALNPATGVAAAGATEPPQQVLVQSWCQQFSAHAMDDLEFDSTGALLVSAGDGATFTTEDYGQFGNPCGDPPNEGGSLRSQDVQTPAPHDQTDYSGSIIRIDPATGEALPTNPLFSSSDVRARRILAYGFRNPFRFEIRPGTSELYVGDVGWDEWEELDRLSSPPAAGTALNFGWPCFEGANGTNHVAEGWKALAEAEPSKAPLCQNLYEAPGLVTASFYAYGHGVTAGYLFSGDKCDPSPGAAITGLAFYQAAGVPAGAVFPAEYRGALFMVDSARGCIWSMAAGADGKPDPANIANFASSDETDLFVPVDIVQGPGGALYVPSFWDDSIEQIRYVGDNQPPTANLVASKIDGPIGAGFDVTFNAGGSTDPEGDTRFYAWDLDEDGVFDDATGPTVKQTYTKPENKVVKVKVSDDFERSDIAEVTIYPGDKGPPVPAIELPSTSLDWAVGDTIAYRGSALEPDGDTLANGKLDLKWTISIRHCPDACHTHPYTEPEGAAGSIVAPPHEYPSQLRFELTATDSRNRSVTTAPLDISPGVGGAGLDTAVASGSQTGATGTVRLTIASNPPGIKLRAGKMQRRGPFTVRIRKGSDLTLRAPHRVERGGRTLKLIGWAVKGKLRKTAALRVIGRSDRRYLAVYGG